MSTVDPLELSARVLAGGEVGEPLNRTDGSLHELGDGIAIVESFSHCVAISTTAGLVVVDTSGRGRGQDMVEALRRWSPDPFAAIVYTHGHLDHVGGSGAFAAEAADRGHSQPEVIAHRRVEERFARYRLTSRYNRIINARQFGSSRRRGSASSSIQDPVFLPDSVMHPTCQVDLEEQMVVGESVLELHHALGETDDHLWGWLPDQQTVLGGDFFTWNFPNAGNPQKMQRYPLEWAAALRDMASCGAELFLPAHGLPIAGSSTIAAVLGLTADTLEKLCLDVIDAMNAGATLDEIVNEVGVEDALLAVPYLRPLYDEPEFIIRNTWRRYGGWWDGNPARLKPPPDAAVAAEVVRLAGGVEVLRDRAMDLGAAGDFRLACQLIEWAHQAAAGNAAVLESRTHLYAERRKTEKSLMSLGIFGSVVAEGEPK